MLIRTVPFRDLDRLTEALRAPGTARHNADGRYLEAGSFVVHLDLPGGSAEFIDLTVEQDVLTVHAERKPRRERAPSARSTKPRTACSAGSRSSATRGTPTGSTPTTDTGVLILTLPIAEKTKPRKGRDHQRLRAQAD